VVQAFTSAERRADFLFRRKEAPLSIRGAVLAFAGLLMLTQSATSAQQNQGNPSNRVEDFSALAGRWQADPPFKEAEGPRPRFVNTLVIGVTAQEITIDRGYSPTERYRLDGTPTDLSDNRTTSVVLVSDGVALTTRRARNLTATIHTDVYRVEGDALTMDSRRSQTQADGSLVQMQGTRVSIVYRRLK
jgi:hypothetical protein